MSSWFGFGKAAKEAVDEGPKAVRALPASWYRSEAMYELERRSIFSRKWLLISHKSRFVNDGAYLRVTEAGYSFFIIKDRKGEIRAHHNVCRHRAYPLVHEESGHLKFLSCKYHGWSYGFDGKLAKAPKYQELSSFDKSQNNLFKVHVHVDRSGFIWVNLEASEMPSEAWEDDFADVDVQPRLRAFDLSEYRFDHQWTMIGNYNWKALADNYNECYHCPTGHPAVNAIADLTKYRVETSGGHIQHFNTNKDDIEKANAVSSHKKMFPRNQAYVGLFSLSPVYFYIQRCIPISATQTNMEYEVYRHKDASDEEFDHINQMYKQVLKEDKDLCEGAQKNLNAGIFMNGELHPRAEKGPLYFQAVTRKSVMEHRKKEEAAGREIWPATPEPSLSEENQDEVDFCKRLDCECGEKEENLEW